MKKTIIAILAVCGVCISYYIGAGFATMQEIVQYEVSYGSLFLVVILVSLAIYTYTNISFITNGNRLSLKRGGDIFGVYCSCLGEKVGKVVSVFFDYFSVFFCYMTFVVMCGGANSTVAQQWGAPSGAGAVILAVLVVGTVFFGLDGIVKSLSNIGPIIIILILIVAVVSTVTGLPDFASNLTALNAGEYSDAIEAVGNGSPILSGASYGGFVVLMFASFLAEIGSNTKLREAKTGVYLSAAFLACVATACCLAIIGHLDITAMADIPSLVLANQISPLLCHIFAFVIFAGIYTTSVPLLWISIRLFSNEGTAKYRILAMVAGTAACIISCIVPYKGLINIIYGINGYLGFALVAVMIIYDCKTGMSKKKSA